MKLALADLKLGIDEVDVTVLEEPIKGFLGIGAKLAKVRVEKKEMFSADDGKSAKNLDEYPDENADAGAAPVSADKKPSKGIIRDLRKNKSKDQDQESAASPARRSDSSRRGSETAAGRADRHERGKRGRETARDRRDDRQGRRDKVYVKDGTFAASVPGASRFGAPNSGVAEGGVFKASDADNANSGGPAAGVSQAARPENLKPVGDGNAANAFLRELAGNMGLEINIQVFENDECVYIEIDGKDSRTVIGKRGQTLDAVQYLTNLVVNKSHEKYIRVIMDVEGYRSRREKTLEQLAEKLAKKVVRTGRNIRLEPMNPYERKVIHSTLQTNSNVTTRSEGEEPYRRVVIERK